MAANDNCINILLLGESGVGKSTLINAFANYTKLRSFDANTKSNKLQILIPVKFPVTNRNLKQVIITKGKTDPNEHPHLVHLSTKEPKDHIIQVENKKIRFIDTPGFGDEDGINQDDANMTKIMQYIRQFKHLHAICFLHKPNLSVITPYYESCMLNILSQLGNGAYKNILFVFTNTRVTDYKALDTFTNLRTIVESLRKKECTAIPLNYTKGDDNNVFCVDNEGFKYLVAKQQNQSFGDVEDIEESWDISRAVCLKIIQKVSTFTPFHTIEMDNNNTIQANVSVAQVKKRKRTRAKDDEEFKSILRKRIDASWLIREETLNVRENDKKNLETLVLRIFGEYEDDNNTIFGCTQNGVIRQNGGASQIQAQKNKTSFCLIM